MVIYFQFTSISIQVIPAKDLCFIFKNGVPIWAGDKDKLIEILESKRNDTISTVIPTGRCGLLA